ncbi:MAG TPA: hypothetical protein VNA22_06825 [Pyrinomonadaceae bacterium]|nr:hypothetical protein [Pyrinomonadaceae bacterium]
MRYLFDYGEGILCFVPVFFIVAAIGLALLWNNLPDRTKKRTSDDQSHE